MYLAGLTVMGLSASSRDHMCSKYIVLRYRSIDLGSAVEYALSTPSASNVGSDPYLVEVEQRVKRVEQ
jgi:hypothetical protein